MNPSRLPSGVAFDESSRAVRVVDPEIFAEPETLTPRNRQTLDRYRGAGRVLFFNEGLSATAKEIGVSRQSLSKLCATVAARMGMAFFFFSEPHRAALRAAQTQRWQRKKNAAAMERTTATAEESAMKPEEAKK